MVRAEEVDERDQDLPGSPSRGGMLLATLFGLSGLFGLFYFISTVKYLQDSTPQQGAKAARLRVPLKALRFANGVAGPLSYATNEGIFLTHHDGRWFALEQTCPHQGCPVDWQPDAGRFVCPCHGAAFDRLGNVAQGPSARGLYRHLVQVEPATLLIEGRL